MLVNTESVFCAADDKDNHRGTGGGERENGRKECVKQGISQEISTPDFLRPHRHNHVQIQ